MKTVKVFGLDIPERLSDENARELVILDKNGQYCPKHEYKEYVRRRNAAQANAK